MTRRSSVPNREEGAVAATTAIILTVLLMLMAFVVDFGLVRADVRNSQTASDNAAQAAVAALADGGTHEEACEAAVELLESSLGISLPGTFCSPFAPATFGDCDARTSADPVAHPPTTDPTDTPLRPVYVQRTEEPFTVRIQMPVRDGDPQMTQQDPDPDFDGDDPCNRVAVSLRRNRDLVFGGFAGGSGPVAGFADAVSRYEIERNELEISSLVVLDPNACTALEVASNNGRLLVENLEDGGGNIEQAGRITVDSTGEKIGGTDGCDNSTRYAMVTGGSGARLCAGVDPDNVIRDPADPGPDESPNYILASGYCDSTPETLETPSVTTNPSAAYGKAAAEDSVDEGPSDPNARNIGPPPVFADPIKRTIADWEWNCRDNDGGPYPLSSNSGDEWHPLYETDIPTCSGRAANLDELAEDLAEGDGFLNSEWTTINTCSIGTGDDLTIGDGSQNLYFDCDTLNVQGTLRVHPRDFIVVRGPIEGTNSSTNLHINVDDAGGNVGADAVMVIQGKTSGNPGYGLNIGSSADVNINRTAVYMHTGALKSNADDMRWTAPEDEAYDTDGNIVNCDEQVAHGAYDLPSPECFHKLAMWTNNTGSHDMAGGGQLDVAGVFFAPYAGYSNPSQVFTVTGNSGARLTKAQFFTYRFKLGGGALLSMRPDPNFNLFEPDVRLSLIR